MEHLCRRGLGDDFPGRVIDFVGPSVEAFWGEGVEQWLALHTWVDCATVPALTPLSDCQRHNEAVVVVPFSCSRIDIRYFNRSELTRRPRPSVFFCFRCSSSHSCRRPYPAEFTHEHRVS